MNASPVAPAVGTWQHEFAQQPFRKALRRLPNVAAMALAVALCVNAFFGIVNGRRLTTIQKGHYPLMQATRSLEATLGRLQLVLQDVAASADTTRFADADSLSRTFTSQLQSIASNPTISDSEMGRLSGEFAGYYALARTTSRLLIESGPSDAVLPALRVMQQQFMALSQTLARMRERSVAAMEQAFW